MQAFSAQSAFSSSGSSLPSGSPHGHSEHRTKVKKALRKNQNEKYRLKYLRLRKAARAMIFVSRIPWETEYSKPDFNFSLRAVIVWLYLS